MSWRTLLRLGLVVLLFALLLPVANATLGLADSREVDHRAGWLLRASLVPLGLALVLWLLEKMGLRVSGSRCADCRRRIPYGHAYCLDHLRSRVFDAQERERHGPGPRT